MGFCSQYSFKILDIMQEDVIPKGGFLIQSIPDIQTIHSYIPYSYTLPFRQSNIIPCLVFHPLQDLIFIMPKIDINSVCWKNIIKCFLVITVYIVKIES